MSVTIPDWLAVLMAEPSLADQIEKQLDWKGAEELEKELRREKEESEEMLRKEAEEREKKWSYSHEHCVGIVICEPGFGRAMFPAGSTPTLITPRIAPLNIGFEGFPDVEIFEISYPVEDGSRSYMSPLFKTRQPCV